MADEHSETEKRESTEAEAEQSAPADTEAERKAEPETPEEYKAELERLEAALKEAGEQSLRAQAEAQNTLRRAEKDVEKAHKFGQERLVSDLLVVVDNLERALDSADKEEEKLKPIIEGVELTLKSLVDALKKHNVEQLDPQGEPFDPQLHQAMTTVENADVEPNTVVDVYQKGYTLHGRLVRPAMVVVSKAPVEA